MLAWKSFTDYCQIAYLLGNLTTWLFLLIHSCDYWNPKGGRDDSRGNWNSNWLQLLTVICCFLPLSSRASTAFRMQGRLIPLASSTLAMRFVPYSIFHMFSTLSTSRTSPFPKVLSMISVHEEKRTTKLTTPFLTVNAFLSTICWMRTHYIIPPTPASTFQKVD